MIKYDLILTIVNRGFADEVMDAARRAGTFGGTVVNARGTGTNELQKFFGATIQPEKEMVLILTEREKRTVMMEVICRDAGLSKAGMGICFSLPVDGVTGISRFAEPAPKHQDIKDEVASNKNDDKAQADKVVQSDKALASSEQALPKMKEQPKEQS